jgi:hypothetical protein
MLKWECWLEERCDEDAFLQRRYQRGRFESHEDQWNYPHQISKQGVHK